MWRLRLAIAGSLLFASPLYAATTFDFNPVTKKLDLIVDTSNAGTITGVSVTLTGTICTSYANDGALTTDAVGNVICSDDDTGGTLNSFVTWDTPSGTDIVADSSTDTAIFTASGIVITGTAASDTIDFTIDTQLSELIGDVTATNAGVTTIQPNSVALTTDTTGNYLQDLSCNFTMSGCVVASEGTQPTIGVLGASLTSAHLNSLDTPADEESLTFESSTGQFEWQAGSGGNSFETIAVPAGTNPVADSSTDTLTITETSFLTITGTAATDTIDITQVTTDLGTDGLIAADAVALGTDTTNAYVADLTAGTYIDVSGGGAETANITVSMDATEVEAVTWGAGGNASNVWTFNLSGTDPVVTLSSGTFGVTDGVLTVADAVTNGNMTTLSTTNTATYGVSGLRTIRGASLSTTSSGAANNTGLQAGLLVDNEVTGTGTLTSNFGIDVTNSATGGTTGTISANTGLRITHEGFPDDGSTVTTSTGIDLIASTTTSDFTNAYGLKIAIDSDPGSTGTSRYAIYFADGTEALGADATNEYGLFQVGTAMNKLSNLSIGNGATSAGVLTLLEDTDAGSNFASFQVPALAANTVYTLPANDGDASQFLQTDGAGVLIWATSSGSGDITDVFNCSSGDCASIVAGATDLLNFSGNDSSTTTEGLILPQHATTCAGGTAEGQVCWDADSDALLIGNGATLTTVGSASQPNADKEFVWPMPALLPLEAAESIPPIAKDVGTNLDQMTVDFDQSTDECRTVVFLAPPDITAGGTVTFTVVWYSASVTANNVIWDFRHNSGVAEGVDPDAALTTEASAADAVQGTAGQVTVTTWTETQTNLGWAASDLVEGVVCRDADNVSDNFAADARAVTFGVRIPRS